MWKSHRCLLASCEKLLSHGQQQPACWTHTWQWLGAVKGKWAASVVLTRGVCWRAQPSYGKQSHHVEGFVEDWHKPEHWGLMVNHIAIRVLTVSPKHMHFPIGLQGACENGRTGRSNRHVIWNARRATCWENVDIAIVWKLQFLIRFISHNCAKHCSVNFNPGYSSRLQ